MKIKTVLWTLIAFSLLFAACAAPTPEEAAEPPETEAPEATEPMATEEMETEEPEGLGTVIVGTNAEYPPFELVNEDGDIVGFDIELMNAIADAAGFEVEFVNTRWDGIFVALASGEFDAVISAATITP
jgi:polar amino acid transport system substrate-binding protein